MAKQKKQKIAEKPAAETSKQTDAKVSFAFGRENYKWLFVGLAFILVGFLLMIGGGSDNPNEFSEDIFNFRRLTLAPILILAGYAIEIYAIMKKPKQ